MKRTSDYKIHFGLMSGLFVLGEGVILLPSAENGKYTVLGYLLALITLFLLYLAVMPLANLIFTKTADSRLKKLFCCVLITTVAVYSLFCAANCFNAFFRFATAVLLPDSPRLFSLILLSLTAIYFSLKPKSVFLKFALIAFFLTSLTVIFLTLVSASNFDIKNIYIYSFPKLMPLFKSTLPFLRVVALPALLLPFFEAAVLGKSGYSKGFGISIGSCLLGACLLCSVLIFSPELVGKLNYPYTLAVSTVTLGRLFTRADSLSYFVFFAAVTVKTSACLIIAIKSLKRIKEILS